MAVNHPAIIVIGLGKTGLSCARHLAAQGKSFAIADTRSNPPCLSQLRAEQPEVEVLLGPLDKTRLAQARQLIVSPGMPSDHPAIKAAVDAGVTISSDIDLFCQAVTAPVIAITGSNAKSTVTTLVGLMAQRAGKQVGIGGNLGTPVLDLLQQGPQELYVLELSSFQLEITDQLKAEVSAILNVSPDHMDRYQSLLDYRRAKQRIFRGCRRAVENLDDPQTQALLPAEVAVSKFGLEQPGEGVFGVIEEEGVRYLALGRDKLLAASELKIKGNHNISNALAALAIGRAAGLPMAAMISALRDFEGLPHRCQWVAQKRGVDYYNDSKGTNVGATVAAIEGLGAALEGRLILIAGGESKGAVFNELVAPVKKYCRAVVLIGTDAKVLAKVLAPGLATHQFIVKKDSMEEAVQQAAEFAVPGDAVLLSPACASFDMFDNFEARGDAFIAAARAIS